MAEQLGTAQVSLCNNQYLPVIDGNHPSTTLRTLGTAAAKRQDKVHLWRTGAALPKRPGK
jgi:hypothetical protein